MPAPEELRRMPLTPVDGFVLSRVDGRSSEEEIVQVTGLSVEQVSTSLERLAKLSLVSLGDAPTRLSGTIETAVGGVATAAPTGARPAAPAEASVDLTAEEQQRILEIHKQLDTTDHYALLGVARDAVRKEVKRAYYERAAAYHPDRYFRRNVGAFKGRLETIFGRVTLAHDVLTDKVQRAEYDAYLAEVARAQELEARVQRGEATVRAAEAALVGDAKPRAAAPAASPEAAPAPSPAPPPDSAPKAAASGEVRRISRPMIPIDPQARRDLLAKHLTGGRPHPPATTAAREAPPPPPSDPEALRRHFDQRKADVVRAQGQRHKLAGDQALASGDVIAAASSYKAALTFLPDDRELQRLHAEAQSASSSALAATYRNQASYEEKSGRWPDAAKSWIKLAELTPKDASAQERAGNAILQAKGNMHDAATYAQRAVALAPDNANYRKLLATIYLEAGLLKNARRELDAAEHITPGDVTIAALAKRLANATGR